MLMICVRSVICKQRVARWQVAHAVQHKYGNGNRLALISKNKGIQYLPQGNNDAPSYNRSTSQSSMPSPLSPTTGRPIQPQQGKDVPLSSAPTSWPLYVVEIKAGRTDLFYLTGLIRVLGNVVNDSITLMEVKAFEHEQRERFAYGDGGPLSLGGQKGSKKDIHLNMIYGETQPQDRQYDDSLQRRKTN
ncbi:hypothetical protein EDC04DRAFT_2911737 [Pisolithus marmoratus]|nr:hypothetical protein EDC04DRAFT_2911737 [Pisolithus marmoratus]